MHISALITCHNRPELTLRGLSQLRVLDLPEGTRLDIVLMDDGSTDGTGAAVHGMFPAVEILHGDGTLYWCGGMRMAWKHAAKRDPEFYLLVNDDTMVERDALLELLKIVAAPDARKIGVGAIQDPTTGFATYGGRRGANGIILVNPTGQPELCATFNANLVLIPRAVFLELGFFHHAYTHGMGDFDYGFQASRRGIQVLQTPGFVGACSHNSPGGSWRDRRLSRRERLKRLHSPKAHPWKEMVAYHRRNSGCLWPYRCITPYLRILLGR